MGASSGGSLQRLRDDSTQGPEQKRACGFGGFCFAAFASGFGGLGASGLAFLAAGFAAPFSNGRFFFSPAADAAAPSIAVCITATACGASRILSYKQSVCSECPLPYAGPGLAHIPTFNLLPPSLHIQHTQQAALRSAEQLLQADMPANAGLQPSEQGHEACDPETGVIP